MNKSIFVIISVILALLLGSAFDIAQAAGDTTAEGILNGQQSGVVSVASAPLPFQVLIALVIGFCLMVACLPMFMEDREGLLD